MFEAECALIAFSVSATAKMGGSAQEICSRSLPRKRFWQTEHPERGDDAPIHVEDGLPAHAVTEGILPMQFSEGEDRANAEPRFESTGQVRFLCHNGRIDDKASTYPH